MERRTLLVLSSETWLRWRRWNIFIFGFRAHRKWHSICERSVAMKKFKWKTHSLVSGIYYYCGIEPFPFAILCRQRSYDAKGAMILSVGRRHIWIKCNFCFSYSSVVIEYASKCVYSSLQTHKTTQLSWQSCRCRLPCNTTTTTTTTPFEPFSALPQKRRVSKMGTDSFSVACEHNGV